METDNFQLSEEQAMILETVRKFAQDKLEPTALDNDEHAVFVRASFDELAELGMLGIPLSEDSGGADMGWLSLVVAIEELGRVCGSTARLLLSQTALCGLALEGSDVAEEVAGGEKLAAFVGPEVGISATVAGDGFVLNGCVELVTAALEADIFVVAARTSEAETVVCCLPAQTVVCEPSYPLGFRATAAGRVRLQDVAVSPEAIVVRGQDAEAVLQRVHQAACVAAGAMAVGMAEASIAAVSGHCSERIAFGKPLDRQQAVALKVSDCVQATTAARHLVYHAARLLDSGRDAGSAAAMAKLAGVQAAVQAGDEGIQALGGYGFVVEYHVERHYRDAMTLANLEGGMESLRMSVVN